jgi:hypothetical protein
LARPRCDDTRLVFICLKRLTSPIRFCKGRFTQANIVLVITHSWARHKAIATTVPPPIARCTLNPKPMMMGPLFFRSSSIGSLLFQVFHGFLFLICFLWLVRTMKHDLFLYPFVTYFEVCQGSNIFFSLKKMNSLPGHIYGGEKEKKWIHSQDTSMVVKTTFISQPFISQLLVFRLPFGFFLVHPQTLMWASTGA